LGEDFHDPMRFAYKPNADVNYEFKEVNLSEINTGFSRRYNSFILNEEPVSIRQVTLQLSETLSEKEEEEDDEKCGTQTQLIFLDAYEHALIKRMNYNGRYFIFLMSHSIHSKTDSFVGYTPDPVYNVLLHNEKLMDNTTTSKAAPHWILDIVLGPFISKEQAIDCAKAWVSGTRGKNAKRNKAPYLSKIYNVDMYTYMEKMEDTELKRLFDEYLPDYPLEINDPK
jgi:hypothetical protein